MEEQFKLGNIVHLKPIGPLMTISIIHTDSVRAECVWFEKRTDGLFNGPFRETFKMFNLVKVSE